MKKIFFIIFILIYLASLKSISFTKALFTDTGTSSASFTAGYWSPSISNISSLVATPNNLNDLKATITWTTDENATSNIEYRLSSGLYTDISPNPEDITADYTSHSLEITPLDPETTYYYRVKSKNSSGYETVSSEYSFTTNGVRSGIPLGEDIVINEFLPNPAGADDAAMPNGEWVELYNRGSDLVDLTGWFLTDSNPTHLLSITTTNTTSSNSTTSDLWIAPDEFMAVYRNGDSDFALNNDAAGDQVNLYNDVSVLIDQHIYNSGSGDTVLENKSFARFPDGTDIWFDPIPTPGRPNILELLQSLATPQPLLSLSYFSETHLISFTVNNTGAYKKLEYQLIYDSDNGQQGVIGSQDLNNQEQFTKDKIILGTCSSGGTCVYHNGVKNIKLSIDLSDQNNVITHLEKTTE